MSQPSLCFCCFSADASVACEKCGRAFYCSSQCQCQDWQSNHGALCQEAAGWQVQVALRKSELKGRYVEVQQDVKSGELLLVDYALISLPESLHAVQCLLEFDYRNHCHDQNDFTLNESSAFFYPPLALLAIASELESHSGLPEAFISLMTFVWHRSAVQSRSKEENQGRRGGEEGEEEDNEEEVCLTDIWRVLSLSAPPGTSLVADDEAIVEASAEAESKEEEPPPTIAAQPECSKATLVECFTLVLEYLRKRHTLLAHYLKPCTTCPLSSWAHSLHKQAERLFDASLLADISLKWINNAMAWGSVLDQEAQGASVFLLGAMLEHNCEPNAAWNVREDWTRLKLVANRDIVQGEAISISYIPKDTAPQELKEQTCLSSEVTARQSHFMEHWGFHCSCARCKREMDTSATTTSSSSSDSPSSASTSASTSSASTSTSSASTSASTSSASTSSASTIPTCASSAIFHTSTFSTYGCYY